MNTQRERPNLDILNKDIQFIEKYLGISPDTNLSYNELRTFISEHYDDALTASCEFITEYIEEYE